MYISLYNVHPFIYFLLTLQKVIYLRNKTTHITDYLLCKLIDVLDGAISMHIIKNPSQRKDMCVVSICYNFQNYFLFK